MILHNIEEIKKASTYDEKKRLRNLNNSMLQRLKKRREQENDVRQRQQRKQRIDYLCSVLGNSIDEDQKKRIAKLLNKQSQKLKELGRVIIQEENLDLSDNDEELP